jgi:hypothetical protein
MRRICALFSVLVSTLTFAQTPVQKSLPTPWRTTFPIPVTDTGCPVGFSASRQAGGQVLTASDAKSVGPEQGLHLMFDYPSGPAIQSIEVIIYASSLKPQALLLDMRSPDTISKTFTLERQPGSTALTDADVWMRQAGSIRWADLISITFTDGTTWHSTEDFKCHAVPSNFLLVRHAQRDQKSY